MAGRGRYALVAAAHQRGLRVLLDYVPNHTSDEHPWFTDSPDFYRWRDPAPDGGPPNKRKRRTRRHGGGLVGGPGVEGEADGARRRYLRWR